MSLRAIHIVLITLSIALSFGFGMWGVRSYWEYRQSLNGVMGFGSLVFGSVLCAYLVWFIRKLNKARNSS